MVLPSIKIWFGYNGSWTNNIWFIYLLYLLWSRTNGDLLPQILFVLFIWLICPTTSRTNQINLANIFPNYPNWQHLSKVNYIITTILSFMATPGQVVCITASGRPGRGFDSAVMLKIMHFLANFRFAFPA